MTSSSRRSADASSAQSCPWICARSSALRRCACSSLASAACKARCWTRTRRGTGASCASSARRSISVGPSTPSKVNTAWTIPFGPPCRRSVPSPSPRKTPRKRRTPTASRRPAIGWWCPRTRRLRTERSRGAPSTQARRRSAPRRRRRARRSDRTLKSRCTPGTPRNASPCRRSSSASSRRCFARPRRRRVPNSPPPRRRRLRRRRRPSTRRPSRKPPIARRTRSARSPRKSRRNSPLRLGTSPRRRPRRHPRRPMSVFRRRRQATPTRRTTRGTTRAAPVRSGSPSSRRRKTTSWKRRCSPPFPRRSRARTPSPA
mmetsp:Transcript_4377/g.18667  ORF Transcript_4377/g.18667 Transcript_4377/m.18667 type:complete len:316 (+) Transcript_4377:3678-4625(+)